jgi:RNA polymerase sigma-70 factor, ECF subfamily
LAVQMVGDSDNASDILQEVFVTLFEKLNGGTAVLYINTWLYRVTLNKSIDYVKRQKKYEKIDVLPEDSFENDSLEEKEKKVIIRKALKTLKPKEHAMLVMYSEGFSYKEISDSIGIRFSSVGKTLERTLEKMERQLKDSRNELY